MDKKQLIEKIERQQACLLIAAGLSPFVLVAAMLVVSAK